MAFGCVLYLKSECDGCGWCEDNHPPCRMFGGEEAIPFDDWEEE